MTTKAQQLVDLIKSREQDQRKFAEMARDRLGVMVRALELELGQPAKIDRLEMVQVEGEDDVLKGFDGTLIGRKGCYFGVEIDLGTWSFTHHSSVFPIGDHVKARTDDKDQHAIDVTTEAGAQEWAKWVVETWIQAELSQTVEASISKQVNVRL